MQNMVVIIEKLLKNEIERGKLSNNLDTRKISFIIMGFANGISTFSGQRIPDININDLINELVEIIYRYLISSNLIIKDL